MSIVRIVLMLVLLAGCGAGQAPDFKAGGALVKCEPTPCGK